MSNASKELGLVIMAIALLTIALTLSSIRIDSTLNPTEPLESKMFYHFKMTFRNLTTTDGYAVSSNTDELQVLNQYLSENHIVWEELNNVEIVGLKGGD